jgi:hypothetical protein
MDKLTQQLGEALDALQDVHEHPKLYGAATAANIVYQAHKALRAYHDALAAERDYPDICPKCHNDPDACNCDGYFDRK